jgi:glyoxylase I family protein
MQIESTAPLGHTGRMPVHHLAVLASDLAASERFYCELFGLSVLRRWHHDDGRHRSTWLALGPGAFLALERATPGSTPRDDAAVGWHFVAFTVTAAERAHFRERASELGISIERETEHTTYVRDPDGALVGVSTYPL